jgi:predicted DNA-binding transcriptional regulator AlpA
MMGVERFERILAEIIKNPDDRAWLVEQFEALAWGRGDEPERVRLVSPRRAAEITSLSSRHLSRLSKAGKFPGEIRLGDEVGAVRLAYVEEEVLQWGEQRITAARHVVPTPPAAAPNGVTKSFGSRIEPPAEPRKRGRGQPRREPDVASRGV